MDKDPEWMTDAITQVTEFSLPFASAVRKMRDATGPVTLTGQEVAAVLEGFRLLRNEIREGEDDERSKT